MSLKNENWLHFKVGLLIVAIALVVVGVMAALGRL